jgi:hypothetical protein
MKQKDHLEHCLTRIAVLGWSWIVIEDELARAYQPDEAAMIQRRISAMLIRAARPGWEDVNVSCSLHIRGKHLELSLLDCEALLETFNHWRMRWLGIDEAGLAELDCAVARVAERMGWREPAKASA